MSFRNFMVARPRQVRSQVSSISKLPPISSSLVDPTSLMLPKQSVNEIIGRLPFQYTSIIGKRPQNEDAEVVIENDCYQVFAIFDGHGGVEASQFCAENLNRFIIQATSGEAMQTYFQVQKVITSAIQALDKQLCLNANCQHVGTTAAIVIYLFKLKQLVIIYVGDSRVLVGYHQQQIKHQIAAPTRIKSATSTSRDKYFATEDHKPNVTKERLRLSKDFPSTKIIQVDGCSRIDGILSLSRAIGDNYLKDSGVICDPDITFIMQNFSYILLACDGYFDVFSNAETDEMIRTMLSDSLLPSLQFAGICEVALHYYRGLEYKGDQLWRRFGTFPVASTMYENIDINAPQLKKVSQVLAKMAYQKGSQDNITVMLISGNII